VRNARFTGDRLLVAEMTISGGAVAWDLNGRAAEDWKSYYERTLRSRRGRGRFQRGGRGRTGGAAQRRRR
jgi:hypothetical protein